jgi:hypothetical protein
MPSRTRRPQSPDPHATARSILRQYGGVVTESDAAEVLRFPNRLALRRAVELGRLPIRMFEIPGRRGRWVLFSCLADALDAINAPAPREVAPVPAGLIPPRTPRLRVKPRPLDLSGITGDVPDDYDPFDLREFDLVRRHTPTDSLDE